jgi:hypothetical protein
VKLINIYKQNAGTQVVSGQGILASGTKHQLEELGCKFVKKAWILPENLMPLMADGDSIVHEEVNLASTKIMVNLPAFMCEYLKAVGAANNNATISSIVQSLILDQIDREEAEANKAKEG